MRESTWAFPPPSEAGLPYLDYRAIGAEYCAECGAYGPFGYVCRKDAMGQATKKQTAVITIHPRTLEIDETMCKHCCLSLPATDGELDRVKDEMDIDSFTDAYIYGEE